jgi:hypothetical protein
MTKENLEQKHDHWRRLVEEQKQSNLSQKEFCNQRNIVLSQFVYYRCKLKKEFNQPIPSNCFASVKLSEKKDIISQGVLKLSLPNGFHCAVPYNIDTAQLKRLVEVLLSC